MPYQKFRVDQAATGERLDRFLSEAGVWPSRAFVQKIIASGGVVRNGAPAKSGYRLELDDELEVTWEDPQPLQVVPEAIFVEILFEDSDIVVVNKPRGMVVHPAAGNYSGTLVNALLAHCTDLSGIGGVMRPGIVHRLDKDTSGILVVAKNDLAHLNLASQIKARAFKRIYQALVHGNPPPSGRVEASIGRHPVERKKMAVVPNGRPAVSKFQVSEYFRHYAWLEVSLETGRTHQIRVHLAFLGYPLVGDLIYGWKKEPAPITGQALHAMTLGFKHPRNGTWLEFDAVMPDQMVRALEWCRNQ